MRKRRAVELCGVQDRYRALKDNGNQVKVISLILTNKICWKKVTDNKVNETVS